MQKRRCFALLMALLMLLLCACGPEELWQPEGTEGETDPVRHSSLYLPGYTAQQITEYFEEVVLHVEYSDGIGEDDLVQKWLAPIYYRVYGTPTDADIAVLEELTKQLNAVAGFPGIYPAKEDGQENMSIRFLYPDAFYDDFSVVTNGEESYGAVQYWYYIENNEIHTADIGCRVDIEQRSRNSVLVEEVINALGITDTVLREDSITYQYTDDNSALSEVDLVILKLLYDPAIQCGMDAAACAAVIEQLYY